jgi:hypothetical protein
MTRLISINVIVDEIVVSECYPFNALFVFETTAEFCEPDPVWTKGENISRLPERIILWN